MALARIDDFRFAGVATCTPPRSTDNLEAGTSYGETEVRKVTSMAGVRYRRISDIAVTSADLCHEAAVQLLDRLGWARDSITGLILVTQTPDYFLPSTSCVVHKWLGLSDRCAAFDVGLGCSGYPYGLYLAASMLRAGGHQRILVLHGETPSKFCNPDDHATTLLFGDAGSATALESRQGAPAAWFGQFTDGTGYDQLIIRGGGFRDREPTVAAHRFVEMDGAAIFNFTVKRVPALIRDTLGAAGMAVGDVDQYLFHQSNKFIMKHIAKKCGLPEERVPIILERFGNSGGPSVALALTQSMAGPRDRAMRTLMVAYGVGLSWSSALVEVDRDALILHSDYTGQMSRL